MSKTKVVDGLVTKVHFDDIHAAYKNLIEEHIASILPTYILRKDYKKEFMDKYITNEEE